MSALTGAEATVFDAPAARRWLPFGRVAARFAAFATFVVAFAVLDSAADSSFAGHMTQHMLLVVVLAPAIVLGWAPRHPPRLVTGAAFALLAVSAQTVALALWHVPAFFDAADGHLLVHACEHLTLLATAVATWWVILASPVGATTRVATCAAAAAPMVLLGALITFAADPWYPAYAATQSTGHVLTDQQVGGAIMWGPAGIAYVVAAGWIVAQAIVRDERRMPRAESSR